MASPSQASSRLSWWWACHGWWLQLEKTARAQAILEAPDMRLSPHLKIHPIPRFYSLSLTGKLRQQEGEKEVQGESETPFLSRSLSLSGIKPLDP